MSLKKRITAGIVAAMACMAMVVPSISASAADNDYTGKTRGELMGEIYSINAYDSATKYFYSSDLDEFYADAGKFMAKNRHIFDFNNDGEVYSWNDESRNTRNKSIYELDYNYTKIINAVGRSGLLSKYATFKRKSAMKTIEDNCKNYTYAKRRNGQAIFDYKTLHVDKDFLDNFINKLYGCGHIVGDVNTDGVVNKTDYTALTNYVQGKKTVQQISGGDIGTLYKELYDVNHDNRIDATDTLLLMKYTR